MHTQNAIPPRHNSPNPVLKANFPVQFSIMRGILPIMHVRFSILQRLLLIMPALLPMLNRQFQIIPMLRAIMHVFFPKNPMLNLEKHGTDRFLHGHFPRAPTIFLPIPATDGICRTAALRCTASQMSNTKAMHPFNSTLNL
jgi:hypothetical protein